MSLISYNNAEVIVSGSDTLLVCEWKQVLVVDGRKYESLHNFGYRAEDLDRLIQSAESGDLSWFRYGDDNG